MPDTERTQLQGRMGFPFGGGPRPARAGARNRDRLEGVAAGGWHRNWMALMPSADVGPGQVAGRDVLGERVLVARSTDGTPSVLTAYCRHFGADLSIGSLVGGDCVACPFHAWTYDLSIGRGLSNGAGEPLPEDATLFRFPTRERYGLIWAFNGEEPDRDVPGFPGIADEDLLVRSLQVCSPAYNEPWVQFSNSHDFTHLRHLHGAEVLSGPDDFYLGAHEGGHRVVFRMPSGRVYDHVVRVHGTNAIMLAVTVDGDPDETFYNMFTAVTVDDTTMLQTMITATAAALEPERAGRLLAESAEYGQILSADDDVVLSNARFGPDLVQAGDRELMLYFAYARGFPRHDPFARYRRAAPR